MGSSSLTIPGADRAQIPPAERRRLWLRRRAAISSAAVALLLERALGELPSDAIDWPCPVWAGPVPEVVFA